jgi:hypothetical protein
MNPIVTDFKGTGLREQLVAQQQQLEMTQHIREMSRGSYRKLVDESRGRTGLCENDKRDKARADRKRRRKAKRSR